MGSKVISKRAFNLVEAACSLFVNRVLDEFDQPMALTINSKPRTGSLPVNSSRENVFLNVISCRNAVSSLPQTVLKSRSSVLKPETRMKVSAQLAPVGS